MEPFFTKTFSYYKSTKKAPKYAKFLAVFQTILLNQNFLREAIKKKTKKLWTFDGRQPLMEDNH